MRLFLFLTSLAGWTREALASVTTTTCPNGRLSCPGYGDNSAYKYCCQTSMPGGYYCCNYWEKEMADNNSRNIPEIVGGVIGAVLALAFIVVLSCYFCHCCYIYKYRHRKRQTSEPTARRPSSNLGWRYRNWPRSALIPSTTPTCNGITSSSNRYYYNSRQHNQYSNQYRNPLSMTRNRHDSTLQRLQHQPSVDGDDCGGYDGRSPTAYGPYMYQPINILGDTKQFEAPPPYPIAQYYPTFPPSIVPETQVTRTVPLATSPISTSASTTTSTTVIHDDLLQTSGMNETQNNGSVLSTGDIPDLTAFITSVNCSQKSS